MSQFSKEQNKDQLWRERCHASISGLPWWSERTNPIRARGL